jgi:hypothetical protein
MPGALTCSAPASLDPANRSLPPASVPEPTTRATCGLQQSTSSAWYDHDTACWRTYQACFLLGTSAPFSATWSKAGMTRDGVFYPQPKWERRISEIGYGLWQTPRAIYGERPGMKDSRHLTGQVLRFPTPKSTDGDRGGRGDLLQEVRGNVSPSGHWPTPKASRRGDCPSERNRRSPSLESAVRMWPTPVANDAKNNGGPSQMRRDAPNLNAVVGGQLNPRWVEWLMGWPIGWTSLEPLATGRFLQWLRQHGGC